MNFHKYGLGLLSIATILPFFPAVTDSAYSCAVVAPSTQVAISGDPSQVHQSNQIHTSYEDNCLGNAAVGTNTQVGIGSAPTTQIHEGNFAVGGGEYNSTNVNSPYVEVTPEIKLNLRSPAHDPNYLNHLYSQ